MQSGGQEDGIAMIFSSITFIAHKSNGGGGHGPPHSYTTTYYPFYYYSPVVECSFHTLWVINKIHVFVNSSWSPILF